VIAQTSGFEYASLQDIIEATADADQAGVLIADQIQDVGNLGAILRSAAGLGFDGVVIPKDRAAPVTPAVVRRSAGCAFRVPVARVTNIARTLEDLKEAGITAAASLTPQQVERFHGTALDAGLDILVIQGTVVSAEHVSKNAEPLNLKKFIRELEIPVIAGGCASYSTALHLMRTGAVGVLVGVGPGAACTTRGVLGVGYHTDQREFAPGTIITSPMWDWTPFYVEQAEAFLNGSWEGHSWWGDIQSGVFDIAPFGDFVPEDVRDQVNEARSQMMDGEEPVFAGPLYDQQGNRLVPEGETLSDQKIRQMDFLVEGVVGDLPN
jgi:hypothetical protein